MAPLRLWSTLSRSRRWILAAVASAVVVAAVVILLPQWLPVSRPALSFAARDWILITDFDNKTGNSIFDRSLAGAFTVSLEQSQHANVFPRAQIAATLKRMQRPPGTPIDEALGREICERENIRGLVACTISKVGQRWALAARLIDPKNGNTVRSYSGSAQDENGVLPALGAIATQLRRDLGESLSSIQKSDRPLPKVTTSSLQALKLYEDGNLLWDKGQYAEAVKRYQSTLQHDPDFAKAHAALGWAYYSHIFNNFTKGKEHWEKALKLSDRVTERERLSMEASYHHDLGHFQEAAESYRIYLSAYPDDAIKRSGYAGLLLRNGRCEEAIVQYKEVIRIRGDAALENINIANCYRMLGKFKDALTYYARAFELEPWRVTSGTINHEYGLTFITNGQPDKAREVFAKDVAHPDRKFMGLRSMALLDMYQGKYRDAKARFEEAILVSRAQNAPLNVARHHLFMSFVLEGEGDRAGLLSELDKAVKSVQAAGPQPLLHARIGWRYARAGAIEKASRPGCRQEVDR